MGRENGVDTPRRARGNARLSWRHNTGVFGAFGGVPAKISVIIGPKPTAYTHMRGNGLKKMGGNMLNRRTRARGNKQRRGTRRLQAAVRHNRSSESAQNHSQTQETDAFVTVVPLKWPQTRACFAGSDISMVLENGERIFGLIKFRTIFPPVYSSDFVPRGLPSLCVPLRLFPVPNEGVSCARVCLVAAVMLWPLPLRGVRDTRRFTTPAGRESPAPVAAQRTGALPRPCVRRPLPRGEF